MKFTETQLTFDKKGHTMHVTQVFSPDDEWIVFDTRNDDSQITSTEFIEVVNVNTREVKTIYQTKHQTAYGPGVGAATFSPTDDRVIFIHGIRNADQYRPYGFTRRTAVGVDLNKPFRPVFMDARDIVSPFSPGALRGGTHAHTWSGDGKWISFTYNDYVIDKLAETDPNVCDLRTVGVMVPGEVSVKEDPTMENHSGSLFSVVVTEVKHKPAWGSDEIDKAFDECWIGENGYLDREGKRRKKAIAFQGNTYNEQGQLITEVYVVDLPDNPKQAALDKPLQGTTTTPCNVPAGVVQRRITHSDDGLGGPRFWLRSTPDGSMIGYLAKDAFGFAQLFGVSPNGGEIIQITHNSFAIQGPFNFSPDGKFVVYMADNSVFLNDLKTFQSIRLTERRSDSDKPIGAPVWSNKGNLIAYNRYVADKGEKYIQIFILNWNEISSQLPV